MSQYLAPGANESGVFYQEPVVETTAQIVEAWNGSIVVPSGKSGAIIHSQMQMYYPGFNDEGRAVVATVYAGGVAIAQAGAHAGRNNTGGVGFYGSCTGKVEGAGSYTMSILIKVIDGLAGGGSEFATTDPFSVGSGVVLDTGTPADLSIGESPPNYVVKFHFGGYFAQFF